MKKVKKLRTLMRCLLVATFLFPIQNILECKTFAQQPFSVEQIVSLLEKKVSEAEIIKQVEQYKVNVEPSAENLRALIRAGASDQLLKIIESNLSRDLTIVSPKNDEEAGAVLKIEGRSKKFPGKHLWVFAKRKGLSVWWPQGGEVELEENGHWMQSTFIGEQKDVGFKFEIVAVWVSESIHRELIDYLQSGEKSGRFPGMRLPEGSPIAQVTVRKITP